MRRRRTSVSGVLIPPIAVALGLLLSALAMVAPFWITFLLAGLDGVPGFVSYPERTLDREWSMEHRDSIRRPANLDATRYVRP
jgi:hypothetical protein